MKRTIILTLAGIAFIALVVFGYASVRQRTDAAADTSANANGGAWRAQAKVADDTAVPAIINQPSAPAIFAKELSSLGRGFGGTFAVKNAETSTAMLSDKLRCVLNTKANTCTGGDNSCLMQIGGGLSRMETGVRVVHLAEILASVEAGASTRVEAGTSTRIEGGSSAVR